MINLKHFEIQDNAPEFKIKDEGRVGLPCIVINERILFDYNLLDIESLKNN